MEKVYVQFPRLKERYKQAAGTLGRRTADAGNRTQKYVEAKIMLMDEPMGLFSAAGKGNLRDYQTANQEGNDHPPAEQNAKWHSLSHTSRLCPETGKIVLYKKASDMLENDKC